MGASRKLQGEIDRVLKKVQEGVDLFDSIWNKVYDTENANQKEKFEADLKKEIKKLQRYRDQIKTWIQSSEIKDKKALMDARKLIEREMERFKVCEKETKTKAFSKEGLGQQPKTDPREKAKAETRDWLNNVVGDLESQIDSFEAEIEGLSVKKGKARPPRLVHLETSIVRHKAHIMKLELILRLLDNDELSPEQVNDVRDFIEDYVDRNQEDPDEFSDVDELYSSLPLDKVEALEELVSHAPSSLVKTSLQLTGQDQNEETASLDSTFDSTSRVPSKVGAISSSATVTQSSVPFGVSSGSNPVASYPLARPPVIGPTAASTLPGSVRDETDTSSAITSAPLLSSSSSVKEDDIINFPGRRSPAIPEKGLGRGVNRIPPNQASVSAPLSLNSVRISSPGPLSSIPVAPDMSKRTILSVDERIPIAAASQSLVSPLSNRMLLQQISQGNEGALSIDSSNEVNSVVGGRVFSTSAVGGVPWRPQSAPSFQNQNETGQLRGRPEIAPDQREKYLQRLQQVQQQGHSALLSVPPLAVSSAKQFPMQQNAHLQQAGGLGHNVQAPGSASVTSVQQQLQVPMHKQSQNHAYISSGAKETDLGNSNVDEMHHQTPLDDLNVEPAQSTGLDKGINDDELKSTYVVSSSASIVEVSQLPRSADLSPGQPLQSGHSSASLGVIGRRSVSDLGAIGDNLTALAANPGGLHDQNYNLQMLEAAFFKLPQPKDSQRVKNYLPRHPAATPPSYPQTRAEIIENPAFWERLGMDQFGTDTLFFAFYYQQNTYQQYLAARELKRQSWRYHRKYNTWFQRHEEPKVTTDEFEKGTYVYFDFHITDDNQQGWCQRIKTEFTFEYNYLEDDLVL